MAKQTPAIVVAGVSKTFRLPHEKQSSVKSLFVSMFRRRRYENQKTLKKVSFDIKEGEFFGIVGRNGSGKSTLLKLLAGIYTPNQGQISVNGRLTPFIELGVGFNPELTGRENVYLNGALLGFSRKEMSAMYHEIVEFAELERFMDQKLKNYSSGMQVRLAFSIAIRAQSDILLIDEVLAVGDAIFQQKCYTYFKQLKKHKKTVVFVSHDTGALEEYCDRAVLIDNGAVVKIGEARQITRLYIDLINQVENTASEEKVTTATAQKRWGNRALEVKQASIRSASRPNQNNLFTDQDDSLIIKVTYSSRQATDEPVYGITINDSAGVDVFQSNTLWSDVKTSPMTKGAQVEVEWTIPNAFNSGQFTLSPAVANRLGTIMYDWRDELISFKVHKKRHSAAIINVPHELTLKQTKHIGHKS